MLMASGGSAVARELTVGPGQAYDAPSAAAADAGNGDTVSIMPGTYYDCAVWRANGLTIAGVGADVVVTDRACGGKGAFVIGGEDVVVRGLTFARIRVPDGNGAGIRADGHGLTVLDSRFVNNQVGILGGSGGGDLWIDGCIFDGNGYSSQGQPTHAVLAGSLDRLRIERSVFQHARGGDHITSLARQTELVGDRFDDEGGHMTGPLVFVQGGALTLVGNTVNLTAGAADRPGAVLIAGESAAIVVRGNTLVEPGASVPLLRNWTGTQATQEANIVPASAVAVSDSGTRYHKLRTLLAGWRDQARGFAGRIHSAVVRIAHGLHLAP
jgi:hypothetical protein